MQQTTSKQTNADENIISLEEVKQSLTNPDYQVIGILSRSITSK